MKEKLISLLNNSYAPYSGLKVAAIVEMNDGSIFEGVNVENASYGATICAERVAITNAITKGYKKGDFKNLYLINTRGTIGYPCFICRQVMSEFFNDDNEVIIYSDYTEERIKVKDLIPYPFTEKDL